MKTYVILLILILSTSGFSQVPTIVDTTENVLIDLKKFEFSENLWVDYVDEEIKQRYLINILEERNKALMYVVDEEKKRIEVLKSTLVSQSENYNSLFEFNKSQSKEITQLLKENQKLKTSSSLKTYLLVGSISINVAYLISTKAS